jgi:capsular polysaccharide biosynthesis protein
MEEEVVKEKTLTLSEFFVVLKMNLIWVMLIVVAFITIGGVYAFLFKKTTYTARVDISVRAGNYVIENEDGTLVEKDTAEHLKYQYSALIAPEFEKVFKTYEMQKVLKDKSGNNKYISLRGLSFNYTEESAFFSISYSEKYKGGNPDQIKQELVEKLNFAIDTVREELNSKNPDNSNKYGFLCDKLYVDSYAYTENVGVSTGRTMTILLATLIGIFVACVYTVVIYIVDDRITSIEHAERISNHVVLSVVDISPNFRPHNQAVLENANKGGKE